MKNSNIVEKTTELGKLIAPVKFTLGESEIGLLFNHKQFVKVLTAGKHNLSRWGKDYTLKIHDIAQQKGFQNNAEIIRLAKKHSDAFVNVLQLIETTDKSVAFISHKGVTVDVLMPACDAYIWHDTDDYQVEIITIDDMQAVDAELLQRLRQSPAVLKRLVAEKVLSTAILLEHQIGMMSVDDRFEKVLSAGEYAWWKRSSTVKVNAYNTQGNNAIETDKAVLALAELHNEALQMAIQCLETKENQVAFVYQDGVFIDVLPPACKGFLWKNTHEYRIDYHHITDNERIEDSLWKVLKQEQNVMLSLWNMGLIAMDTLPNQHIGLHYVDKQFVQTLATGEYAWWTLGSSVNIEAVDMRLQNMEISGQEILTQDRVSIRLNLLSTWQVEDAEKLVLNVKNYSDFLYREMQLALRTVVATKTLDELLADKNLLNSEVKDIVEPIAKAQGISVQSVGVKDVILPGEMKDILSKVVEAQKTAEANIIKRREETQATRSLHNTAKVMENNPVLLRLKELESLEKITSQIKELKVYGGMDGLMNGLIDLRTEKKT
ncbi:MAG: slipin family protein [Gammaproteobacteria bacterium]|nr:slipin family protein [Gammaproteobacteria bacterium]